MSQSTVQDQNQACVLRGSKHQLWKREIERKSGRDREKIKGKKEKNMKVREIAREKVYSAWFKRIDRNKKSEIIKLKIKKDKNIWKTKEDIKKGTEEMQH